MTDAEREDKIRTAQKTLAELLTPYAAAGHCGGILVCALVHVEGDQFAKVSVECIPTPEARAVLMQEVAAIAAETAVPVLSEKFVVPLPEKH